MAEMSRELPPYSMLMLPVLRAVDSLGGSASRREINDKIIEFEGYTEEQLAVVYQGRERAESVLIDRMDWARSYCKLAGALDRPSRNLYLISSLGAEILKLPEEDARVRLVELDRGVRAARVRKGRTAPDPMSGRVDVEPEEAVDADADDDTAWTRVLLERLHRLSPTGFEQFSLYLLREFGMELDHRGGPGDEGIDGIGTAPLSDVLSATVAVQVKRYDPSSDRSPIGRDTVALFQRDAMAAGAERAVLVTLGRFSAAARRAAMSFTPKVDLIDGDRLCELALAKGIGVRTRAVVDSAWFDRFDSL